MPHSPYCVLRITVVLFTLIHVIQCSNITYSDIWIGNSSLGDVTIDRLISAVCNMTAAYNLYNSTWETYLDYIEGCLSIGDVTNILDQQDSTHSSVQPIAEIDRVYAVVQEGTNDVFTIGTNLTTLGDVINQIYEHNDVYSRVKRGEDVKLLTIIEVNDTFTDTFKPHNYLVETERAFISDITDRQTDGALVKHMKDKRDWSDLGKYVIYYAAAGASLKLIQVHTRSAMVDKVYKAYVSVGYYVAYFIGDFTGLMAQGLSRFNVELKRSKAPYTTSSG